jgi:hypothetical protein
MAAMRKFADHPRTFDLVRLRKPLNIGDLSRQWGASSLPSRRHPASFVDGLLTF